MNEESRSYWFLLTGLVLGIVFGLLYAWWWSPVAHIDTQPVTLREDFKAEYRKLIALGFASNGDLGRAEARLALLGDNDIVRTLTIQAQDTVANEGSTDAARALGILVTALREGGLPTQVVEVVATLDPDEEQPVEDTPQAEASATTGPDATTAPTQADATQTSAQTPEDGGGEATNTPAPIATPRPSATPAPTEGAPFTLLDFSLICDPDLTSPLIQIYVYDADNRPVPGVQALVSWDGGQDSFFTGLKPEFGYEYGDFVMQEGVSYTLRLADGGEPVSGLTPTECTEGAGEPFLGSWRLNFVQP